MLGAGAAQALEEAFLGRRAPLQRLYDDRGELGGVLCDDARRGGGVVVGRYQGLCHHRRRNAGARGLRLGKIQQAVGKQARHPDLVGAVIGALELENLAAAGGGPCKALAVHRGLGARSAETHALAGGAEPADLLGERQRVLVDVGEVGAELGLTNHRFGHLGPCMPDQRRAPADGEVEKGSAAGIHELAALSPRDDRAKLGRQIELAVGATGENAQRTLSSLRHVGFDHGHMLVLPRLARAETYGTRPTSARNGLRWRKCL